MTESEKLPPRLKKRSLSSKQLQQHNISLGQDGEQQAVTFLQKAGYQIKDCNVRYKTCEIDIVAFDQQYQELVFVEVKTRKNDDFGSPDQAVDYKKLRSLQKVAAIYRQNKHLKNDYRFDIITVLPGRIDHYQNVTWI